MLPGVASPETGARLAPWTDGATPALALSDLSGRTHGLPRYRGRVVVLNFWATWCEPCRDEMPSLQRLGRHLAGQPFAILGVNYGESDARVAEFARRLGLDFPVLLDPNQDAPRAWRVRVLPASFVVDREGRVRYRVVGEIDWMGREVVEAVSRLLSERRS
ncbi:MAG TPA: TlpA disulfide reductase family protein [Vicinamibacteria bacterium]|nr:TlpA disulfide reductase family protein [Vicinamibacteria bacterium]